MVLLLVWVHGLYLLSVFAFRLLNFVKGPKPLRLHYTLYHGLYRERFSGGAVHELVAEPGTAFILTLLSTNDRPELANFEVCIIHKLLIARPH